MHFPGPPKGWISYPNTEAINVEFITKWHLSVAISLTRKYGNWQRIFKSKPFYEFYDLIMYWWGQKLPLEYLVRWANLLLGPGGQISYPNTFSKRIDLMIIYTKFEKKSDEKCRRSSHFREMLTYRRTTNDDDDDDGQSRIGKVHLSFAHVS